MKGYINGVNFLEIEPMKYWSFTAGTSAVVQKDTVFNACMSGEYLGSLKVDGFYERFLKDEDGNCFMIARSRNVHGEIVDKYSYVPHVHSWLDSMPNGTCFLTEAYLPGNEGSKNVTSILGCLLDKALARQQKTPLHISVFDCIAYGGVSMMNWSYERRANMLTLIERRAHEVGDLNKYVNYVEFFEGAELWSKIQEFLAKGCEGMVIMRKDAIVYQKRTPARVSIKVKKELRQTIDCFFTGRASDPIHEYTGKDAANWEYWENSFTGELLHGNHYREWREGATVIPVTKSYYLGLAGSLEIGVMRGDEVYPIGWLSNLSEEIKADPEQYAMKPIEVTAMEVDISNGFSLRHGKMIQFREDLTIKDCTYEKLMEVV